MIGKIYEENTKSIPSMKEAYIKWLNEVDYLSSPNPVLKITKFDVQKIKKISKWYWNNRVEVLNKFEQFNY